jgi:hypothetical protein
MSTGNRDTSLDVPFEAALWLLLAALVAAGFCWCWGAERGLRRGACVEMCRPAKFDNDQEVNGGCLCIGSDKVLRRRPSP